MRISDWSSDVCSSDLVRAGAIAVEKLKLLGIGQTIAQPSVDIGLEHRNIVKNLARCQNPVRDGGDGRRLDVELDFRLWLCRASGFRVRVAAELVKPVSCGSWIELAVERPGVRRRSEENTSELQSLMRNS